MNTTAENDKDNHDVFMEIAMSYTMYKIGRYISDGAERQFNFSELNFTKSLQREYYFQ